MQYGLFKIRISRDKGKVVKTIEDFIPATEEVYIKYLERGAPDPDNELKYVVARFDGDPTDPIIHINENGRISSLTESEFLVEKERLKQTVKDLE